MIQVTGYSDAADPLSLDGAGLNPVESQQWSITTAYSEIVSGTYYGHSFTVNTSVEPDLGLFTVSGGTFPGCYWNIFGTAVFSAGTFTGGAIYETAAAATVTGGSWSGSWTIGLSSHGQWSNYSDQPGTVTFEGSGLSYVAATARAFVASGQVTDITYTYPGGGYTSPPIVTITGGGGSGAAAVASISAGMVNDIIITNGGSDYTSAPNVTLSGVVRGNLLDGTPIDVMITCDVSNGRNTHVEYVSSTAITFSG